LIDTGSNKNYISIKLSSGSRPLKRPFIIKTVNGDIKISKKTRGKFFESVGNNTETNFFILPGLSTFDGIIGDDTLKELEAVIDRGKKLLTITPNIKIPIKEKVITQVGSNH